MTMTNDKRTNDVIFCKMAARQDWCSNQVSKLVSEDLRVPTLNEIKDHFAAVPQEEAKRTANNLELSLVFDCLNDSNPEQVELACEVLAICMSNLNLGESTSRYCTPIERALNHPHSAVKTMALNEIQRSLASEELLTEISKRSTLLNSLIKCIGDDDLSVAKRASTMILDIGASSAGIQQLLSPECLTTIHNVMAINEIVRLRVNQVFVDISKQSETSMRMLQSAGLLSQLLQDVDNNDVLLKMNVIELLSQLVVTKHGYVYLESQGAITKIFKHFEDEDPLTSQLCEPGILKFFGHMAHWKPTEIISKYPAVVDKVFSNIQSDDLTLVGVSLDTLGHVAETNEGKCALESTGNKILTTLKAISDRLISFPVEMRIRALNCLESLIRIVEFESRVTNLVRKWYYAMGDNPMDWIYKFAQTPFSEIRLAGLNVLSALGLHHWGQECFRNTPGFIEYLLDRRNETFKDCKEVKYEIVKLLSSSDVFDHSTQLRLQAFVKEGPFYVQALTEVAVEGED